MAAAVDDESIEKGQKYEGAILCCDTTYVFHSKRDRTVSLAYRAGEFAAGHGPDAALGSRSPDNPAGLSPKIRVINCKRVIHEHGKYKNTDEVYGYIKNELYGTPAPQFSQL
ncbi:MAG: hypothetical protein OXQ32_03135 [bacterium]|nr:hypothetical protein [bacterium]